MCTLPEDRHTFLIISRLFLLRMRNLSHKSCRENQNTHFVFSNASIKSCRLWVKVEKNCRAGRQNITIWRMRIACWISKATNTHSEYVMFIHSTTTMVARMCLSVTLYVHCFSYIDPSWGWVTDTLSEALCSVWNTGQLGPARK